MNPNIDIIDEELFYESGITSLVVPKSVKRIEYAAFKGCHSLEKITLHEGIEYIGPLAFDECINLKSLEIPHSVKEIDSTALLFCSNLEFIKCSASI